MPRRLHMRDEARSGQILGATAYHRMGSDKGREMLDTMCRRSRKDETSRWIAIGTVLGVQTLFAGCAEEDPEQHAQDSSAVIQTETRCGDSVVGGDEECDSGGMDTPDCDRDCTRPVCGDGVLNARVEACDDGDVRESGNGCSATCQRQGACGNRVIESAFEVCDGSSGCSADCKSAAEVWYPVSDRGGTDVGGEGRYEFLHDEGSMGEAVGRSMSRWAGSGVDPAVEEKRVAWEFDAGRLVGTARVSSARLTLSPSNLSGQPQRLQLHTYPGDGSVGVLAMEAATLASSMVISAQAPIVLDVTRTLQAEPEERPRFIGYTLRLENPQVVTAFNMGISMSNSENRELRPKLDVLYCLDVLGDGECD